ncbi:MAG: hypothetical protein GY926_19495 [bacterium]|nr:hypothetical protein [bacterium]
MITAQIYECTRCHVEKHPSAFPKHRGTRRRQAICYACQQDPYSKRRGDELRRTRAELATQKADRAEREAAEEAAEAAQVEADLRAVREEAGC